MKLYDDFSQLAGETIVNTDAFCLTDEDEGCHYSFTILVTQSHGVIFFGIQRFDKSEENVRYMQANTFERYLFLKDRVVQHFLCSSGITMKEVQETQQAILSRNGQRQVHLNTIQKRIRVLRNEAEQLKDSWT